MIHNTYLIITWWGHLHVKDNTGFKHYFHWQLVSRHSFFLCHIRKRSKTKHSWKQLINLLSALAFPHHCKSVPLLSGFEPSGWYPCFTPVGMYRGSFASRSIHMICPWLFFCLCSVIIWQHMLNLYVFFYEYILI